MYLDFKSTHRDTWKYRYAGADMLAASRAKLRELCDQERQLRTDLMRLTADPKVGMNDDRVEDLKRKIAVVAPRVEELTVYVSEFLRDPAKEHFLSAGDVVFLGLVDPNIVAEMQSLVAPTQPA